MKLNAIALVLLCALGAGSARGAKSEVALGACDPACANAGLSCCGGLCVDLRSHVNNCGECGNVCGQAQSCHAGRCTYDLVAACFNTGQLRGIQAGTDITGPLASIGIGPQALAWDENVLLVADIDRKLRQARLPQLTVLARMNDLGNSPNHVWVGDPYIYVVNSISNTLQVFQRMSGKTDTGLELTAIGELNFGPNTSPQAIAKVGNDIYVPLFGGFDGSGGGLSRVDISNPSFPKLVQSTDFGSLDLQPFDGGTTYPRPSGIAAFEGDRRPNLCG